MLLKDHCCLECADKHRADDHCCVECVCGWGGGKHRAAEGSLLFGVHVSKHRAAAAGSFLFAASVFSSH